MKTFFIFFLITFTVMAGACLLINFAKSRSRRTAHGLTGMCHQTGGRMCSSCSSKLAEPPRL